MRALIEKRSAIFYTFINKLCNDWHLTNVIPACSWDSKWQRDSLVNVSMICVFVMADLVLKLCSFGGILCHFENKV